MTKRSDFEAMCPMNCHPTLCGMTFSDEDGQLAGIVGDETNPDSQGFLCMRGKAAREILENTRRILTPLTRAERGSDDWTETDWDDALDTIAGHIALSAERRSGFGKAMATGVTTMPLD